MAKLKQLHQRLSQNPREQASSSQSEEWEDSSDTLTTLKESAPEPLFTSLQSLNTWLLRSWSWLETPPRTTRRPELCQDTSCWPSETTRNSTNCCTTQPLPKEESYPTSAAPFQEPSRAVENHHRLFDLFVLIP